MAYDQLKQQVWDLNMKLARSGLIVLTFGNASGVDREAGVLAIKPSGVDYDQMRPEQMVIVALETGEIVEGDLRPSSDTPTHWILYREFELIAGVIHTHSINATAWAQACRPLPCFGTTHADHFYGEVPLSRTLTDDEIRNDYELNTGRAIADSFRDQGLSADERPGILVPHHGPFVWGSSLEKTLDNAIALESIAWMAQLSLALSPELPAIPQTILDKHFLRKHGGSAYYGQT